MPRLINPCCVHIFLLWANYLVNNSSGKCFLVGSFFFRQLFPMIKGLLGETTVAMCDPHSYYPHKSCHGSWVRSIISFWHLSVFILWLIFYLNLQWIMDIPRHYGPNSIGQQWKTVTCSSRSSYSSKIKMYVLFFGLCMRGTFCTKLNSVAFKGLFCSF